MNHPVRVGPGTMPSFKTEFGCLPSCPLLHLCSRRMQRCADAQVGWQRIGQQAATPKALQCMHNFVARCIKAFNLESAFNLKAGSGLQPSSSSSVRANRTASPNESTKNMRKNWRRGTRFVLHEHTMASIQALILHSPGLVVQWLCIVMWRRANGRLVSLNCAKFQWMHLALFIGRTLGMLVKAWHPPIAALVCRQCPAPHLCDARRPL